LRNGALSSYLAVSSLYNYVSISSLIILY
jgi:hypothetical protein